MPHVHRFYIAPDTVPSPEVALAPDEAHHALHVVRVQIGDPVVLFDGQGREIEGTVSRVSRHDASVRCNSDRRVPPPATRLTLLQAALLREKSVEFVVQHGTELGVAHFCFFRAQHSDKPPRDNPKWTRLAIETCKQCGRLWLPTFDTAPDLETAIEHAQGTLLVATNDLEPVAIREALEGKAASVALLVGPEGDFTPDEVRMAKERGAIPISLGTHTFRSEIAATIGASLILHQLGELGPR
jgi:16S rRNA (uracil1498-N3)-methyltransferase